MFPIGNGNGEPGGAGMAGGSESGTDAPDLSGTDMADGTDTGVPGTAGADESEDPVIDLSDDAVTPEPPTSVIGVQTYETILRGLIAVIDKERLKGVHARFSDFRFQVASDRLATQIDGLSFVSEESISDEITRYE